MMKKFLLLFAFCILNSIAADYRVINQKKYSMTNPLNKNEYFTLVHIKKSKLKSCLEATLYGQKPEQVNININGMDTIVICDQTTDGGGWTHILEMNEIMPPQAIIPIDDKELTYTQVLFKAKPGYLMHLSAQGQPNWNFDGYNFVLNSLKFGDNWLMSQQETFIEDYPLDYYQNTRGQITNKNYFNIDTDINIITPSDSCLFYLTNSPGSCAKEFILKNLPSGRLNAISEIESVSNKNYQDNKWYAYFDLYVR